MKTLLLATLVLSSCACYANVVKGPDKNGHYVVDNCGKEMECKNSKVKLMPESEARQMQSFKSNSPIALF
jgi:hypothetical protein